LGGSTIGGGTPGVLKHAAPRPPLAALRARLGVPANVPLATLPVSAAGAALFVTAVYVFASTGPSRSAIVGSLALLGAALLAEAFPVPIEGVAAGRTSLANIFIVGTAVIYGWTEASIIGALTMGLVELAHRRPVSRIAFNTGLYTLAAGAAGAAAAGIDGTGLAALLLATAIASAAYYLVDITLLSG
jgi:hypothetical protein